MQRTDWVTRSFRADEVCCKCEACAAQLDVLVPSPSIMTRLQSIRDSVNKPIVVSAGVRCLAHNQAIGGAHDSRHLPAAADAVDVECQDSGDRYLLVRAAIKVGVTFIEVCPSHVHLDMRPGFPRLITGEDH